MKSIRNRRISIYVELLKLIFFATVAAGIFFVAVFYGGASVQICGDVR